MWTSDNELRFYMGYIGLLELVTLIHLWHHFARANMYYIFTFPIKIRVEKIELGVYVSIFFVPLSEDFNEQNQNAIHDYVT